MQENEKLQNKRHSLAHLLAAAVLELYPDAKRTIGPAIDNGFYYDFEFPTPVTEEDLPKIEKKMRQILPTWDKFERSELTAEEAKKEYEDNPYKIELIDEFTKDGEKVSFYKSGDYWDLCRGGHAESMKEVDPQSFKLTKLAGAYWRGDEKNKMLSRIYGLAFDTKEELESHLKMLEEAEKRDHKKLGKQMGLFTFSPTVGPGLPMYMPKGNIIRSAILDFVSQLKKDRNYQFVWTPHIGKEDLYKQSGHFGKYDAMLPAIETSEGERLILKPMNCPHHFQIYNAEPHSYRDLPYRIAENATDYRNEKSGELNGLFRVRSLTQDDTHHVIRHDQIASEIDMILSLTREVFEVFGFKNFHVEISAWDPAHPENYFGTSEMWENAQNALIEGAKRWGAPYKVVEGEAAFYGPKIDIRVEDAIGRSWQLTTVQLDYNQPENFDMTYAAQDGTAARPAIIHAAILGSIDRFMGIVIEHYSGNFPLWLAPVQVAILPVSEKHLEYAAKVKAELCAVIPDLRIEMDDSNESIGKKIRGATLKKNAYMLIVGDKEIEAGAASGRQRDGTDLGSMKVSDLAAKLKQELDEKK